jgi:hypothetical protein
MWATVIPQHVSICPGRQILGNLGERLGSSVITLHVDPQTVTQFTLTAAAAVLPGHQTLLVQASAVINICPIEKAQDGGLFRREPGSGGSRIPDCLREWRVHSRSWISCRELVFVCSAYSTPHHLQQRDVSHILRRKYGLEDQLWRPASSCHTNGIQSQLRLG